MFISHCFSRIEIVVIDVVLAVLPHFAAIYLCFHVLCCHTQEQFRTCEVGDETLFFLDWSRLKFSNQRQLNQYKATSNLSK